MRRPDRERDRDRDRDREPRDRERKREREDGERDRKREDGERDRKREDGERDRKRERRTENGIDGRHEKVKHFQVTTICSQNTADTVELFLGHTSSVRPGGGLCSSASWPAESKGVICRARTGTDRSGKMGRGGKTASANAIGTMAAAMSAAVTMTGAAPFPSMPDPMYCMMGSLKG